MQFTPLRQALDNRMQRRIRRNHLAEEVEGFEQEKKQMKELQKEIEAKDAELKSLKSQVFKPNPRHQHTSLSPIREVPIVPIDERINDVEAELSLLRRSFQEFDETDKPSHDDDEGIFGGSDDWSDVPRTTTSGPRSDSGDTIQIYEDDTSSRYPSTIHLSSSSDAHDAATMSVELASARQAKKTFLQSSFGRGSLDASEIHFADSPTKPTVHISSPMPKVNGHVLSSLNKQLKAATARAEDAELALEALEGEVRALSSGFTDDQDAMEGLRALADHFRQIRLELERLLPGEIALSLDATHALLPELTSQLKDVLGQLGQRSLELQNLRNQERTLRGNFDQTARICQAAQKKIDELEKALDECAESSLDARVRANHAEKVRDERDRDNECLRGSLETYRHEVGRLEHLIGTMEAEHRIALNDVRNDASASREELEAKAAAEITGRRAAEESAVSRLRKIQELEEKLQHAKERASEVEQSLQQDVDGLNSRLSNVSTALVSANQETDKLRKLLHKCEQKYRDEVFRGEETVRVMRDEMMKAATRVMASSKGYRRASKVSLANWELESDDVDMDENGLPMTPSSTVRFADYSDVQELEYSDDIDHDENELDVDETEEREESGDECVPGSVETARGKKKSVPLTPFNIAANRKGRRKYDSGIGIDDTMGESDLDIDDSGLATPDLSSEADAEMELLQQPVF